MNTRPWLVPVAAALGVLALLLGMRWAVSGGSSVGVGPDPDRRGIDVPLPDLPTRIPEAFDVGSGTARITGYRAVGRGLSVAYTITDRECVLLVIRPVAHESPSAVTLQLQRLPAPDDQLFSCPDFAIPQTAQVRLAAALGSRTVRDAGNNNAAVPELGR